MAKVDHSMNYNGDVMDAEQPKSLWTIDGIDFFSYGDIMPLLGGEESKLAQWCKDNNAVLGIWNALKELSPCYSSYLQKAQDKDWTKVVLVGYSDASGAEWKPKDKTPR